MSEASLKPSCGPDPEQIESLKQEYLENVLGSVESFAQQTARYGEEANQEAARKAHGNFESFCRLAAEMIRKLRDPEIAETFLARLRRAGWDPEGS